MDEYKFNTDQLVKRKEQVNYETKTKNNSDFFIECQCFFA